MTPEDFPQSARISVSGYLLWLCTAAFGWVIAGFTAFNLLGELIRPGFDANVLWMPLLPLGAWGGRVLLGLTALFLFWSLLKPACSTWRSLVTRSLLAFLTLFAVADGTTFYAQIIRGEIESSFPLPYAWFVAAVLILQMWRVRRGATEPPATERTGRVANVIATLTGYVGAIIVFLLAQFFLFGNIAHLRKAHCVIVMGAGVRPDGTASVTLRDRTLTACRLFKNGKADRLIFSGGPTDVGVSEPQAMARIAEEQGIPSGKYICDPRGLSTYDTVISTRRIMRENEWRTAIVVTHDYHLSRTWLAFRRAGVEVYTYPAERSRITGKDLFNFARESAAWVYYYFRPLWQPL